MFLQVFMLVLFSALFSSSGFLVTAGQTTQPPGYSYVGCYNDGTDRVLPVNLGDFRKTPEPVAECARITRQRGFKAFGIQDGGDCWSGPNAQKDYNKWGKSTQCHGGVGGSYDNDVYLINAVTQVPCKVGLPEHTPLYCQRKRYQDLQKTRKIYSLAPSRLALFPELNMTAKQLIAELAKDIKDLKWMKLYTDMIKRNQNLAKTFMYMTYKKPSFTSIVEYKELLKFMIGKQKESIPPVYQKYFRFHFQRPGKPFKKFTTLCDWREDRVFTDQRLAGINPLSMQRASWGWSGFKGGVNWWKLYHSKLNRAFDWNDAIKDALGRRMSLYSAIAYGYVYVLHYPLMDGIPKNVQDVPDIYPPIRGRVLMDAVSPIAVFVSKSNRRRGKPNRLVPVAIQMGHTKDSKVYTPDDGDMWLLAKQTIQVADFAHVSIVDHLLKLHFFMEPICVCVTRHFHPLHPLNQMMKYHCRGVLGSKMFGGPMLLARNGTINKLMTIGLRGGAVLLNRAHHAFDWNQIDFMGDLKRRGMLDKYKVPYYPYRDDGMLVYKAIQSMASRYVDLYYKSDNDVRQDTELQNFANEVSANGKRQPYGGNGKIKGFPSSIKYRWQLKDILARLIWASSAQHSVVNYPSNYYGLYTPSAPTKLYNDSSITPGEFDIHNLPNKYTAVSQAALGMTLASMFYDTLFDYSKDLTDVNAAKIVQDHSALLMGAVRMRIEADNRKRFEQSHLPYPYLVPGWIANSIHT